MRTFGEEFIEREAESKGDALADYLDSLDYPLAWEVENAARHPNRKRVVL
jgi:hypothetical protein